MTCVNIRLFVLCIQNTYLEKLYLGNNLETFYIYRSMFHTIQSIIKNINMTFFGSTIKIQRKNIEKDLDHKHTPR